MTEYISRCHHTQPLQAVSSLHPSFLQEHRYDITLITPSFHMTYFSPLWVKRHNISHLQISLNLSNAVTCKLAQPKRKFLQLNVLKYAQAEINKTLVIAWKTQTTGFWYQKLHFSALHYKTLEQQLLTTYWVVPHIRSLHRSWDWLHTKLSIMP